jgi:hypothetical protein
MLPDLSRQILSQLAGGESSTGVLVTVKDGALAYEWEAVPAAVS